MRYSIQPRDRKFVEGYGFLSIAKSPALEQLECLLKILNLKIVKKAAVVTGNLIGKKIANKITSVCKSRKYTT